MIPILVVIHGLKCPLPENDAVSHEICAPGAQRPVVGGNMCLSFSFVGKGPGKPL